MDDCDIFNTILYIALKHKDQKRKYNSEPYINHCIRVAKKVHYYLNIIDNSRILDSVKYESIITALLHDVVEDTDVTIDEIKNYFGWMVADNVDCLTEPSEGLRKDRMLKYNQKLFNSTRKVKLIKLCDIQDNLSDFYKVETNRKYKIKYLKEKIEQARICFSYEFNNVYAETMDIIIKNLFEMNLSVNDNI